jgi:hypothetical protein
LLQQITPADFGGVMRYGDFVHPGGHRPKPLNPRDQIGEIIGTFRQHPTLGVDARSMPKS